MELITNVSYTLPATIIRVDAKNNTSILMMEAETVSETLDVNSILTWLKARENFEN
jgi:hypothetical protein